MLLIATAWSATLTVGTNQTYSTIQDAINAASDGDRVEVDNGTYNRILHLFGKALHMPLAKLFAFRLTSRNRKSHQGQGH